MHNIKINQVYVVPAPVGILRRVRILAPHPDGGFIVEVIYPVKLIEEISGLKLKARYVIEIDVCEHKAIEDAYISTSSYSPEVPNYYRCIDCGDLFPNIGDTNLWFPKQLEVKVAH